MLPGLCGFVPSIIPPWSQGPATFPEPLVILGISGLAAITGR